MLMLPNDKLLKFNFCNFTCIVKSKMQPTIDILSMIMNWMLGHMYIIVLSLFILICLSNENLNR
jgi:hypothetical protein